MGQSTNRPTLDYYLNLSYPVLVYPPDREGGEFVAEIPDLPGCFTQAATLADLYEMIADAKLGWLTVAYEEGDEIPLPRTEEKYSGKFVARVPVSLHRRLAETAEAEGVSLNQYIVHLLSGGVQVDMVNRRIDNLCQSMANVERSIGYEVRPIQRSQRIRDWPKPQVLLGSSGTKVAVAS